ncbi:MAG: hypothetical protein H7125_02625 [Proteobacteria bacterium]|nr:hypothetical protein [Burkholderiales bacterium]
MNDLPFIDPTAGGNRAAVMPAPRPMDLAGKVVAMVDNTKEQGDLILETVAQALRDRYGVARVIIRRKEHYSKPATDQLIDELAQEAQLAVAAVGG